MVRKQKNKKKKNVNPHFLTDQGPLQLLQHVQQNDLSKTQSILVQGQHHQIQEVFGAQGQPITGYSDVSLNTIYTNEASIHSSIFTFPHCLIRGISIRFFLKTWKPLVIKEMKSTGHANSISQSHRCIVLGGQCNICTAQQWCHLFIYFPFHRFSLANPTYYFV